MTFLDIKKPLPPERRGFGAKNTLPYGSTAASGSRGLAFATLSPFF
jgi:hypothetical protein